jgi:hypothetical protein
MKKLFYDLLGLSILKSLILLASCSSILLHRYITLESVRNSTGRTLPFHEPTDPVLP